ncbi:MAG: hypothetical protein K8S55_08240 [Phycisphaerae bacterium]|nr:hypothetical protein [Phycisphaerae bacterium]
MGKVNHVRASFINILWFLLFLGGNVGLLQARESVCLNGVWRCQEAKDNKAPSGDWHYIRVPHRLRLGVFDITDSGGRVIPGSDELQKNAVRFWFQRDVVVPKKWIGKKIFLRFGSVGVYAKVLVNGKVAGEHYGESTSFKFDITNLVTPGKKCVISVLALNRKAVGKTVPGGGSGGYAGIREDVFLDALPQTRVENLHIITSFREKTIKVKTWVRNDGDKRKKITLTAFVLKDGKEVKKLPAQEFWLKPGQSREIETIQKWIAPRLWTHETPHLYNLRTELRSGGEVVDTLTTRFGFREFWVEKDSFYLNGAKVHLLGEGTLGPSRHFLTPETTRAWVRLLKDSNHNCVRFHTGPAQPWVWDICDEEGILAVSQSSFFQLSRNDVNPPEFWKNMKTEIDEWIPADRNHPSIIMWNADNEIHHLKYSLRLKKMINKYDATRPIQYGGDSAYKTSMPHCLGNKDYYDSPEVEVLSTYFYACYGYAAGGEGQSYGFQDLLKREKWPPVWQKLTDKPIVIDEFSYPYDFCDVKMLRNKDRKGHVAWLIGDEAYLEAGDYDARGLNVKAISFGDSAVKSRVYSPTYIKARSLIGEDLLSAWRCYDFAGIVEFESFCLTANAWYDFSAIKLNYTPEELALPGMRPKCPAAFFRGDSFLNTCKPELPPYRPNKLFHTVKKAFAPIFLYLGGDMEIANKRHVWFAGDDMRKTLCLINDRLDKKVFRLYLGFEDSSGKVYQTINKTLTLLPGEVKRQKVKFNIPDFAAKTKCRVKIIAVSDGEEYKRDFAVTVFPKPGCLKTVCKIGVRGDSLAGLLGKRMAGIVPVKTMAEIEQCDIVFCDSADWLEREAEKAEKFMRKGGMIVCLCRESVAGVEVDRFTVKNLFPRAKGHPLLGGIDADDLARMEITALPMWAKPERGAFRPIIDGGYRLDYASMLEFVIGKGRLVCLSLPVREYGAEPIITTLVDNCVRYRDSLVAKLLPAAYMGGAEGAAFLAGLGLTLPKVENPGQAGVLFVGADVSDKLAKITEFVKKGGKAVFLKRQNFDNLPFDLNVAKTKTNRLNFRRRPPLMRGIANADLYWDEEVEVLAFNRFPIHAFATRPAALLQIPYGGEFVFLQLDKKDIAAIGPRANRAVSIMLTNLGVECKVPPTWKITASDPVAIDASIKPGEGLQVSAAILLQNYSWQATRGELKAKFSGRETSQKISLPAKRRKRVLVPLAAELGDISATLKLAAKPDTGETVETETLAKAIVIPHIRQGSITIDGRPGDKEWKKTAATKRFVRLNKRFKPLNQNAVARMAYDEKKLYIAIKCDESQIDALRAQHSVTVHDGPVWEDDELEVFLSTGSDPAKYFHFLVNSIGTRADEMKLDKKWSGQWQAATSIGKNGWTAEICIPFKSLGQKAPASGTVWRLNLCRSRRVGKAEYSVWSQTNGGFHKSGKFGYLIFGGKFPDGG